MKILIVDDEVHIRRTIRTVLARMSFVQVCEASDGISAWEEIAAFQPDLVIADVKMPGMDGIELLTKIRESGNELIYIIVSGFDYFEYAQKSINLGAFSYLLKPVNEEELTKKLIAAKSLCDMRKNHAIRHNAVDLDGSDNPEIVSKHFLSDIANGVLVNQIQMREIMKELAFPDPFGPCFVVVAKIENWLGTTTSENYWNILLARIEKQVLSVFQQAGFDAYLFGVNEGAGFVVRLCTAIDEADKGQKQAVECLKKAMMSIDQVLSIGIGITVDCFEQLPTAYQSAQNALSQKFAHPGNRIFMASAVKPSTNALIIGFPIEQKMLSAFEKNDVHLAQAIIRNVYDRHVKSICIDFESIKRLNYQIVILLFKVMTYMKASPEVVLGDELVFFEKMNTIETVDSMLSYFLENISKCMKAVHEQKSNVDDGLLDRVSAYIQANPFSAISLESISEHLHISPEYFSRQFKKECGENFIDYVTRLKIEKARWLLAEQKLTVSEVSFQVGYNSIKHFTKIFKKHTNQTPGHYRGKA
jgi:two-component system, response regulator YesN